MTATAPLRAFVVDDEPLALKRLSRMLTATGRVEVVGQATDPEKALPLISAQPVDVLFPWWCSPPRTTSTPCAPSR
jgi:two-component system response regulator AlgR